jgi:hypothetical protein
MDPFVAGTVDPSSDTRTGTPTPAAQPAPRDERGERRGVVRNPRGRTGGPPQMDPFVAGDDERVPHDGTMVG